MTTENDIRRKRLNDLHDEIQNASPGEPTHMQVLTICEKIVDYLRDDLQLKEPRLQSVASNRLVDLADPLDAEALGDAALTLIHADWLHVSGCSADDYDLSWFKDVLNNEADIKWFARGWLDDYDLSWFKDVLNNEADIKWFARGWLASHSLFSTLSGDEWIVHQISDEQGATRYIIAPAQVSIDNLLEAGESVDTTTDMTSLLGSNAVKVKAL